MQQSSTSWVFLVGGGGGGGGVAEDFACSQSSSQCLLVSTVFGMVSSLQPTSLLILCEGENSHIRCPEITIRTLP